jgi:lysophospholipase L1-like esterase
LRYAEVAIMSIESKNHRAIGLITALIMFMLISAQSLVAEIMVVAIGDAITYGSTGSQLLGHRNTIFGGWVTRLQDKLEEDFPGGYQVLNKGISGDTSNGIFNRLNRDVIAHQPGIVIIGIGTNDAYGADVVNVPASNADDYRVVMTDIFDKLKQELPDVPVFIMGMTTPLKKYLDMAGFGWAVPQDQDFLDTQFKKYNDVLKDLTQKYGHFYVDIPGNWPRDIEGSWEFYADGIHINDAGYDKMADVLYQHLLSTVISPETAVSIYGSSAITWGQVKCIK